MNATVHDLTSLPQEIKWPPFTQQMLDSLIAKTVSETAGLMMMKGAEYAHGSDRLDNFRRNAVDSGVQPETVWRIYAAKHWDSITTYVKDIQSGKHREYSEPIEGRFHDMINYCLLGLAMVAARKEYLQNSIQFPEPPGFVPTSLTAMRQFEDTIQKTQRQFHGSIIPVNPDNLR